MKVALYGASDRYNYGDILMPIVFKEWFNRYSKCEMEYINCALIESKMSYCGGMDTLAIKNIPEVDAIVLTGGEVTGTILTDIVSNTFDESDKLKIFSFKVFRKLFPKKMNSYLSRKYGTNIPYLFAINPENRIVIYNTVGGSMAYRKESTYKDYIMAVSYINKASYVSCRTEFDKAKLEEAIDSPAYCYPDSVVLLSRLFSKNDLKQRCRKEILDCLDQIYYVFQSYNLAPMELDSVANAIKNLYSQTGMKCFLLPIAYAQNHGDVQTLYALHKKCKKESIFPSQTNIYETAAVLAHSKAYCGTSLHGVITAISYGIPHCTWRKSHYKTVRFLESWRTTKYIYAEYSNVEDILFKLLYDEENKALVENKSAELIELAVENFRKIEEIFLRCQS